MIKVKEKVRAFFQRNLRDWKYWYKLFAFILATTFLLFSLIMGFIEIGSDLGPAPDHLPKWNLENGWDYESKLLMYFSYFTNQTNWLVAFWLLWALIFPKKEGQGKLLSFTGSILVATYISITGIIWLGVLFPASLVSGNARPWYDWMSSVVLHVIIPVMFVLYVTLWMKKVFAIGPLKWLKRSWITMIYPAIYGVIMLIRGEIRLASGHSSASSYPYFFLEIHATSFGISGVAWFFIAIFLIMGIAIGFSTVYAWVINNRYLKINLQEVKETKQIIDELEKEEVPVIEEPDKLIALEKEEPEKIEETKKVIDDEEK